MIEKNDKLRRKCVASKHLDWIIHIFLSFKPTYKASSAYFKTWGHSQQIELAKSATNHPVQSVSTHGWWKWKPVNSQHVSEERGPRFHWFNSGSCCWLHC